MPAAARNSRGGSAARRVSPVGRTTQCRCTAAIWVWNVRTRLGQLDNHLRRRASAHTRSGHTADRSPAAVAVAATTSRNCNGGPFPSSRLSPLCSALLRASFLASLKRLPFFLHRPLHNGAFVFAFSSVESRRLVRAYPLIDDVAGRLSTLAPNNVANISRLKDTLQ